MVSLHHPITTVNFERNGDTKSDRKLRGAVAHIFPAIRIILRSFDCNSAHIRIICSAKITYLFNRTSEDGRD